MAENLQKEIQTIHRILDERYKEEFAHREKTDQQFRQTNQQFDQIMAQLKKFEPVLKIYDTGLSWSEGALWLTKIIMKIIGGLGLVAGTIIAIKEILKK